MREEISCPYDKRRNGMVLSEGSCMLVLEELGHALRRGVKIYGELKGCGFSFDPDIMRSAGISSAGASAAMQKALNASGCSPEQIDYIAGSANSTRRLDVMEADAIKRVFKNTADKIPVSSIKSMLGDSLSASGAFNVGSAIGALEYGFIPPTINYRVPDRNCALNIAANKTARKNIANVMVNSFGYNGHNGCVIIGKYDG
jgi:3-oxoacyl-[acyl-carrier-protein] synthase II